MRVLPNRYAIETIRQVSLTKKLFYFNLKSFAHLSCVFTQLEIVFNRSLKIPDFLNYVSEFFTVNHDSNFKSKKQELLKIFFQLYPGTFYKLDLIYLKPPLNNSVLLV